MSFEHIFISQLSTINKLLIIGKLVEAGRIEINDEECLVKSPSFKPIAERKTISDYQYSEILFRADKWDGDFSEYDMISKFWPIIPENLFNQLKKSRRNEIEVINERTIEIHKFSNGITAIAELDSRLINPQTGVYQLESRHLNDKKVSCKVGLFEKIANNFELYEINDFHQTNENKPLYVLYVFINPQLLTEEEENALKNYTDIHNYENGIRNGWSLLFLGKIRQSPIIIPGLASRKKMTNLIDSKLWNEIKDEDYRFLDNTPLNTYRKESKRKK